MAQVKDGINGTVRGKAGNVVFYTMYGKNIVRSRPDIRNKRKKPSLKQETQRQRMKLVQSLLQPFKDLIKITFAPVTQNNAPYHVAKSYNLRHAIKGEEYPDQEVNWNTVCLSAGSLELPENFDLKKDNEGLRFHWSGSEGRADDTLLVIAFDSTVVKYQLTGVSRYKKEFFWDVKLGQAKWHVWIAFRSKDEQQISNSMYLGMV